MCILFCTCILDCKLYFSDEVNFCTVIYSIIIKLVHTLFETVFEPLVQFSKLDREQTDSLMPFNNGNSCLVAVWMFISLDHLPFKLRFQKCVTVCNIN